MNKIILKINKEEELLYPVSGYILGFKNFCICFEKTFNIKEIIEIKKNTNKKVFVSLNRPVFNDELDNYKSILLRLDNLGLDGIIVGDIAALTYNLKTALILDQLHLNNSVLSINHYLNNNLKGAVLTNDITLDEINYISKNTNAILFKQVFGLPHLSTSVRKLVTNYKNMFKIESKNKIYKLKEEKDGQELTVIEDYFGTHILSSNVLNLLNFLDNIDVDYFIFDGYLLNDYKWVLESFIDNNKIINEQINKSFNANTGFIDKKTIYRVKKND